MSTGEPFIYPSSNPPSPSPVNKAVGTFFSTISFLWHRFFIFCVGFVIGCIFVLSPGIFGGVHKKQSEKPNNVGVEKTSVWGQARTSVVIKN